MTKARQRLLIGLIVLGLAGPGRGFAAMSDEMPRYHLRTGSAAIATLIRQATERSRTFRGLVDAIEASDGIVYIEDGRCGHGIRSCLVNVTAAKPNRILWVMVDPRGVDCDIMGFIGHELWHAVEVLGDPKVTNSTAMYYFYSQRADSLGGPAFETDGATRAGETVRDEVNQKGRCTKIG